MSLTLRLLTAVLIASIALNAGGAPDKETLLKFIKRNIVTNPQVGVKGVTIIEETSHTDLPGWTVLLTTMDINYMGKDIHAPLTIFVKDGLITGSLVNLKTGNDYRDEIKPTVPASMYDDAHLLFGNKDAAHKIVVFSDPQCPFCQEVVPDILKAAQENPSKIAVYYYHLPLLQIHPVSGVLTRVMHVAQQQGAKEMVEKIYRLKISPSETNVAKILDEIKKQTGYTVTAQQIDAQDVNDAIKADEDAAGKMMVTGTPTVFIDGKWDKMRNGYQKLIQ